NLHVRVNAVLIKQIDHVSPETLQSCVCDLADTFRPAVHAIRRNAILEAELSCYDNFLAEGLQSLAGYLFVQKWTVGFGSVKERHAAVIRCPNQRDRLLALSRGAITETQPHTPQANGRNLEIALAKPALLHCSSWEPFPAISARSSTRSGFCS